MSRLYEMTVHIMAHDRSREEAIKEAAKEIWNFDNWDFDGTELMGWGENSLCGGLTEEQFADRLGPAIWKANGGFCEISVDATYLEDLPYETHCLGEDDYQRLMGTAPAQTGMEEQDDKEDDAHH